MAKQLAQERQLENQAVNGYPEKLHLGCARRFIPGFYHVDAQAYPHVDRVADVSDLSFLPDNTVTLIYASSVLEHFGRHEYMDVLAEWYRVLKKGGVLRLSVPDFDAAVAVYLDRERFPDGLRRIHGALIGGQRDRWDFHKMVFNAQLLTESLMQTGFRTCRHWDWRKTEHSHVDDYSQAYQPHMDKTNGIHQALNLEGVK